MDNKVVFRLKIPLNIKLRIHELEEMFCQYVQSVEKEGGVGLIYLDGEPIAEIYVGNQFDELREYLGDFQEFIEEDKTVWEDIQLGRWSIAMRENERFAAVLIFNISSTPKFPEDSQNQRLIFRTSDRQAHWNDTSVKEMVDKTVRCPNCDRIVGRCYCHRRLRCNGPPKRGNWIWIASDRCWMSCVSSR